jgi:hypothetical protein
MGINTPFVAFFSYYHLFAPFLGRGMGNLLIS